MESRSDAGKKLRDAIFMLAELNLFYPNLNYRKCLFQKVSTTPFADAVAGKSDLDVLKDKKSSDDQKKDAASNVEGAVYNSLLLYKKRTLEEISKKTGSKIPSATFLALGKGVKTEQTRIKEAQKLPDSVKPEDVEIISLRNLQNLENKVGPLDKLLRKSKKQKTKQD